MNHFRWPDDHPAVTDAALAPYAASAAALCPDATSVEVLKYQPGRRVTSVVVDGDDQSVVKLYSRHRARKTYTRLRAFEGTEAAALVPAARALDETEHSCLVEFVAGVPVDDLDDDGVVAACSAAGSSLRQLHLSGAALPREWTIENELCQLRKSCGPATEPTVEAVIADIDVHPAGVVPSHRDCYPAQAVLHDGVVRWIDLDDAALAPAGLDVGNFIAHIIDRLGTPDASESSHRAIAGFLDGYGEEPADLTSWIRLSLARLAGLAEVRGCGGIAQRVARATAPVVLP